MEKLSIFKILKAVQNNYFVVSLDIKDAFNLIQVQENLFRFDLERETVSGLCGSKWTFTL